jgi:GNAT superfamily N-acetyltransferase
MRAHEFTNKTITVYHGNQGGIHRELITPMWWTESYEDAKYYATQGGADGWIYKATLSCKNPYVAKRGEEINGLVEHYKRLMELGYDCINDPRVGDWIPFNNKDIHLIDKEYVEGDDLNESFKEFNFDTEPYEGWTGEGLIVKAFDGRDEVGHVIFEPTEDDETQWYAVDVEVEEPYQRRGIATQMYNIAKKAAQAQGKIIVRSHTQSQAGKGLWQDKRVWEE